MNNYCMNNRSQGMRQPTPVSYKSTCNTMPANDACQKADSLHIHWGDLPVAMAYVPSQKFGKIFDLTKGLQVGTIFPELCKPFCGKGGGC